MTAGQIPYASREHIQHRKAQYREFVKRNPDLLERKKNHLKSKLKNISK